MSQLILKFTGDESEFEWDANPKDETIMFHDLKTNTIFMGRGPLSLKNDVKTEHYRTSAGIVSVSGRPSGIDVEIEFYVYSIFKYNDFNDKDRFKVFWNEHKTIIWDTEKKKQVKDNNIHEYLNPPPVDVSDYDEDDYW